MDFSIIIILFVLIIIGVIVYLIWSANQRKKTWSYDILLNAGGGNMQNAPKHEHIHPPGVPPEDLELAGRRAGAIVMIVFGWLIILGAIAGTIFSCTSNIRNLNSNIFFPLIGLIPGIVLAWYGGYLYDKYQHMMWTKQSLREYDQAKMHAEQDSRRQHADLINMEETLHDHNNSPGMYANPRYDPPISVQPVERPPMGPTTIRAARLKIVGDGEIPLSTGDRAIGRGDFDQVNIGKDLQFVSKQHVFLSFKNGKYYIEDRNSSNGTKLLGDEIRGKGKFELKDGYIIILADAVQLIFNV